MNLFINSSDSDRQKRFGRIIVNITKAFLNHNGDEILHGTVVRVLSTGYLKTYRIGEEVNFHIEGLTPYAEPNDLLKGII